MEMKIDGKRIKELRLKLSWSQEKLAEEAGLNPRTVQRAEADGSASLRTRLQLAEALRVLPDELGMAAAVPASEASAPDLARPNSGLAGSSVHYLLVLALVSLIYLAFQPAFFSLSFSKFSWINMSPGRHWSEVGVWGVGNITTWAVLTLPFLLWLHKTHKTLFLPYVAASCAGLFLSTLRLWQPAFVAELLTALLSLSGLALLLSLYVERLSTQLMRHAVYMCLGAYVFIWFCQIFIYYAAELYVRAQVSGRGPSGMGEVLGFMFDVLKRRGDSLAQLIPLFLVVLLSLGGRETREGGASPLASLRRLFGKDSPDAARKQHDAELRAELCESAAQLVEAS